MTVFTFAKCFVFFALALIAACTTLNSKVGSALNLDTNLTVRFDIASDINPDESRHPSPLYLRLYELKTDKLVKSADFIDLYERDKAVLGADLIARQELKRFAPGESRVEKFIVSKDARYIAVYGEFYQYKDAKYKVVFPITKNNVIRNSVRIHISGNTINLVD